MIYRRISEFLPIIHSVSNLRKQLDFIIDNQKEHKVSRIEIGQIDYPGISLGKRSKEELDTNI